MIRPYGARHYPNSGAGLAPPGGLSVADYLNEAAATGEAHWLAGALWDAAHTGNFTHFAEQAGVTREGLRGALQRRGNPRLDMVLRVCSALDLELHFVARRPSRE